MKKILTLIISLFFIGSMQADVSYGYLLFTGIDGSKTALSVTELEMTVSDGQLVAVNADGTRNLTLNELASMCFSETVPAGIASFTGDGAPVKVVSLSGVDYGTYPSVAAARSRLAAGVYVVKQGSETSKIVVR